MVLDLDGEVGGRRDVDAGVGVTEQPTDVGHPRRVVLVALAHVVDERAGQDDVRGAVHPLATRLLERLDQGERAGDDVPDVLAGVVARARPLDGRREEGGALPCGRVYGARFGWPQNSFRFGRSESAWTSSGSSRAWMAASAAFALGYVEK